MIIKPFEKRDADIAELTRLSKLPQVSAKTKADIEKEIRFIRAGDTAEAETAYELDFYIADSKNWAVLHGVRLEIDSTVAQIDHLVINRFLDIYVIESKSFSGGVSINDAGEFCTFYNNRPIPMSSPIEQNERHITVLRRSYKAGHFHEMKRLGVRIPLNYRSVISVGKNARITRPDAPVKGLDRLIKADQIRTLMDDDIDKDSYVGTLASAARIVSAETVQLLAKSMAERHSPIEFDWAGKFGIKEAEPKVATPVKTKTPTKAAAKPKAGPNVCAVCDEPLHWTVVKWCRRNSKKYEGMLLCRDHQKNVVLEGAKT